MPPSQCLKGFVEGKALRLLRTISQQSQQSFERKKKKLCNSPYKTRLPSGPRRKDLNRTKIVYHATRL